MVLLRPLLVGLLGLVLVALVIAASGIGRADPAHRGHGEPALRLPAPVPPVIGDARPYRPAVRPAQITGARATALSFLRGYLPFLYGHGRVAQIRHISAAVRAGLSRTRAHATPAQRVRRPRVIKLTIAAQTRAVVAAAALIDDRGIAPYRLTFTLVRRAGRWTVSALGSA